MGRLRGPVVSNATVVASTRAASSAGGAVTRYNGEVRRGAKEQMPLAVTEAGAEEVDLSSVAQMRRGGDHHLSRLSIVKLKNEDRLVDYKGASKTKHFSAFQGHHEKLVEKAEEVEELLLPALKEQHAIDAGKYLMTMEEWRDTLDQ
ncbi:hypothetical protein PC112_g14320 [Phytophthora cactorum]|nr:hypothetical protein PC112_g14320 [Phytophthora cactorum]